jgi:hypothetical protein
LADQRLRLLLKRARFIKGRVPFDSRRDRRAKQLRVGCLAPQLKDGIVGKVELHRIARWRGERILREGHGRHGKANCDGDAA